MLSGTLPPFMQLIDYQSASMPMVHYAAAATLFMSSLLFMILATLFLKRLSSHVNTYQDPITFRGKLSCVVLSFSAAVGNILLSS